MASVPPVRASGAWPATGVTSSFDDTYALIRRLRAADPVAIARLFELHFDDAHNILLHLLGPEPEVVDLLHDVFVTAVDRIAELRTPSALRAWIGGIAVMKARTFIRRRRQWWRVGARALVAGVRPPFTAGPDISLALRSAYRILDRLPVDLRIPFVLRTVDGLSLDEVAALCGVSRATVKRRLARASELVRRRAAGSSVLRSWLEGSGSWED